MSIIKIQGKYNTAILYGDHHDKSTIEQIKRLMDQEFMKDSKIRVMPDAHAGKGSVIGFTGDMKDKIVPNLVGVDIGCGMLTIELGPVEMDFKKFDKTIHQKIPSGFKIHKEKIEEFEGFKDLYAIKELSEKDRLEKSLGSLGGNHFIEMDQDLEGNKYLIIHSGSRNFGHQIASIYQKKAVELCGKDPSKKDLPKDLAYLEGEEGEKYLHDMAIAQDYASLNRKKIGEILLDKFFGKKLEDYEHFETVHNYIDLDSKIVRKGAVSANKGEKLLIPLNMRDGALIALGKGNPEWNCSAPHGTGRALSRKQAKEELNLKDFKESMKGIYSSSVHKSTLDEAPMAYKPKEAILDVIEDTVEILKEIKPLYNFKG